MLLNRVCVCVLLRLFEIRAKSWRIFTPTFASELKTTRNDDGGAKMKIGRTKQSERTAVKFVFRYVLSKQSVPLKFYKYRRLARDVRLLGA